MELTDSFLTLLQSFDPVFTAPTYQTFVVIITGWILSQRHRYVTEVIFSRSRCRSRPTPSPGTWCQWRGRPASPSSSWSSRADP